MKLKHERIDVQCTHNKPTRIWRRGLYHTVREIHDHWLYRSRWWGREEQRHYFRLQCDDLSMDIFERAGSWFAERVWD